jgi:protease-4
MQGYGFSDLAKRFGVERRVFTAGENKVRMDPFLPLQEDDRLKVNETLAEIHQEFIHIVKEGRGCVPDNAPTCKLKLKTDGLFSGDIWTGSKAIEIGLVDEVGDLYSVMKQDFNVENYVNIPTKRPMFGKLGQWLSSSAEDIVFEAVRRAAESESSLGAFELK